MELRNILKDVTFKHSFMNDVDFCTCTHTYTLTYTQAHTYTCTFTHACTHAHFKIPIEALNLTMKDDDLSDHIIYCSNWDTFFK